MTKARIKPADILLDLLRGAPEQGRSAAWLIENGSLFGFSENMVRVTLSRLSSRERVVSPARGRYRLAGRADPINAFVERWRLGEARVRPWEPGHWLLAHGERITPKAAWALDALGFREVRAGLHARADNLADDIDAVRNIARSIGCDEAVLMLEAQVPAAECEAWRDVWDTSALAREYIDMNEKLRASAKRLREMPVDEARMESFRLGGEGIHILAKDPLLPQEFVDTTLRANLWQIMIEYDRLGRAIWSGGKRETDASLPVPGLANTG